MENLNVFGIQVKSMSEAIQALCCTKENLIYTTRELLIDGFTFNVTIYRTESNPNYYFAVSSSNLDSKQFEDK